MMNQIKKVIKTDLLYKTLIGKQIKIINSKNKCDIGITGKIVFETKTIFHILIKKEVEEEIKKILKKNIEFTIDNKYEIDSNVLKNTLVERIKKMK